MIGEKILKDITKFTVKDTDLNNEIDKVSDDYLYFQLNEIYFEDTKEKARQQTILTSSQMDKTMNSLNKEIEQHFSSGTELTQNIEMDSYNKYNNALDLASKGFYTSALKIIEQARELNPKDSDILNLAGLLNLLNCNLGTSADYFYANFCINHDMMASEYIELTTTQEYKDLLDKINHLLIFYNNENIEDVILFLNKIIETEPYLTWAYKFLYKIYSSNNDEDKANEVMNNLSKIDSDYKYFNIDKQKKINRTKNTDEIEKGKNKLKREKLYKKIVVGGLIILTVSSCVAFAYDSLSNKDSESTSINSTQETISSSNSLDKGRQELIYTQATECRQNKEYDKAIEYYKLILDYGDMPIYLENSLYNLAELSDKLGDTESAKDYLNQYIDRYGKDDLYYDSACYKLIKLYLADNEEDKAKDIANTLKKECPNTKYLELDEIEELLK